MRIPNSPTMRQTFKLVRLGTTLGVGALLIAIGIYGLVMTSVAVCGEVFVQWNNFTIWFMALMRGKLLGAPTVFSGSICRRTCLDNKFGGASYTCRRRRNAFLGVDCRLASPRIRPGLKDIEVVLLL